MKRFYSSLASYCSLAALATSLAGCSRQEQSPQGNQQDVYAFTSFGEITSKELYRKLNDPRLATGDFDGDGDVDIAVSTPAGRIFLLENKMPQKNTNAFERIFERR